MHTVQQAHARMAKTNLGDTLAYVCTRTAMVSCLYNNITGPMIGR
jgi:uncharacterized protein with PIN domain